ncbi:right-handed parallel beta-helix repeat-containing protein [Candidatus Sumerlaeota bacterium]|nr:right-handed parallel beta-helix repeat-containing protein [Candidatus Sumerlaeota bacterium]
MRLSLILCLTLTLVNLSPAGDIDPPGTPSSTMLPLDQVEPREAITSLPRTISESGSYFLTEDLTGSSGNSGITINADHVTLDLRGFSLIGVTGSVDGIQISSGHSNVVIHSGTVRGWGDDGIDADSTNACRVEGIRAIGNGDAGIALSDNSAVADCAADDNVTGIVVNDSCVVTRCTASNNTGDGILTGYSATVSDCTARANGNDGFRADFGSVIRHCTAAVNLGDGIDVLGDCLVLENTCDSQSNPGSAGIRVQIYANRIDGNHLTFNQTGIDAITGSVQSTDNLIVRNSIVHSSGHTIIDINSSVNQVGTTITSGGPLTTDNPWANFAQQH